MPLLNLLVPETIAAATICRPITVTLHGQVPLPSPCWPWPWIWSWGYLGILSLGHGAFFALGGYAMGMYLMRQIGDRGVYGDPVLPDFMVFLNWDSAAMVLVRLRHVLVRRC